MSKKSTILMILPVALMALVISGFSYQNQDNKFPANPSDNLVIPDNVNEILDNKCFGCHNVDAKSDKAKEKLLLDQLTTLSKAKIVAKLDDIHEVVEKGEMPPEKFLEKFPDKALTDEEATILKNWAKSASDELMGE
ncbi:MAG TPA: heme-binding domain-containing protein [Bacteroidales bacterium]|nr:heme-binding domain-containing protein [Bacteroidales bacterium]HRX96938.1 heme-binding domain-containing protein [Bacteroidales bacterium]